MDPDVLHLDDIDGSMVALAGGKGANLGELARIDGIRVPAGFCVTTAAFRRATAASAIRPLLERLSTLRPDDLASIRAVSGEIRERLELSTIPDDLAASITSAVARHGGDSRFAVRSSATAEDLPSASFAGQHDTWLNVEPAAVLEHVRRCWASLFTERAVAYRLRSAVPEGAVAMAVVVQRMVQADAAGVLFTADPVSGNRSVAAVEAVVGLGEALVSGVVRPDTYRVRDGAIVERPNGAIVLTDDQVLRLVEVGRRIQAHFGRPQDIEWCLAGDELLFVQSRPITTLFPVPDAPDDAPRVYLSVGHQQMMTDAMKPLALSFWQLTTPRPMAEAGGRLFVDVTAIVASPPTRAGFLDMARTSDPLIADALEAVIERGFIPTVPDQVPAPAASPGAPPSAGPIPTDAAIVVDLIERNAASVARLRRDIEGLAGPALLDVIEADLQELRRLLFDRRSHEVFTSAMDATHWLNEHLDAWLGEKNVADTLSQSVPHNVTSEMGLALMAVADTIRPHPEVVAFLEGVTDDGFLDSLPGIPGGLEARDAIASFLDRYGMRCAGEIDITRPRWSERPTMLLPLLLGHVRRFTAGEGERRFEQGRREALAKASEVLSRLQRLPDGERKAADTRERIERVRTFIGYREYPKYGMVSRYFVYKLALLREADRLVQAGVLRDREDSYYLRFEELRAVVASGRVDDTVIRERRSAFAEHQALTPPRVLTSEGEGLNGSYRRGDAPAGALVGLGVSSGVVEGRARVVRDMATADIGPGDILVTSFTDPSWTPLFLAIDGLVTEVGGLMTHGAVIAREYGLPAVVGVEGATRRIPDGQRIRVNGTEGYVEILA